jgi:hypothetical protein
MTMELASTNFELPIGLSRPLSRLLKYCMKALTSDSKLEGFVLAIPESMLQVESAHSNPF